MHGGQEFAYGLQPRACVLTPVAVILWARAPAALRSTARGARPPVATTRTTAWSTASATTTTARALDERLEGIGVGCELDWVFNAFDTHIELLLEC